MSDDQQANSVAVTRRRYSLQIILFIAFIVFFVCLRELIIWLQRNVVLGLGSFWPMLLVLLVSGIGCFLLERFLSKKMSRLLGLAKLYSPAALFAAAFGYCLITGWFGMDTTSSIMTIQFYDTYCLISGSSILLAKLILLGGFALIYFFISKRFGRLTNDRLGKIHFWLTFVPLYLLMTYRYEPAPGTARRYMDYGDFGNLHWGYMLHNWHVIWLLLFLLAQILFLINLLYRPKRTLVV